MSALVSLPRMIKGLVVVEMPEGLLIEGASQRRVLRGRGALALLPRLLAALDGTRTINELAGVLPDVPAAHIHQAVTLLGSLGLLDDGNEQRLAQSEVLVIAGPQTAPLLARQLDAIGIGETTTAPHADLIARRLDLGPRPDLVVVVERPTDRRSLERLDRNCARAGVAWLRTAINPAGGEIGPFFRPDGERCYRCFRAHAADGISCLDPELSIVEGWAALVAIEVRHVLTGTVTSGQVTVFDMDRWENSSCSYPPCTPLADCNQSLEGR